MLFLLLMQLFLFTTIESGPPDNFFLSPGVRSSQLRIGLSSRGNVLMNFPNCLIVMYVTERSPTPARNINVQTPKLLVGTALVITSPRLATSVALASFSMLAVIDLSCIRPHSAARATTRLAGGQRSSKRNISVTKGMARHE